MNDGYGWGQGGSGLIVEDGSGVAFADSYTSVSDADAFWTKRPHDSNSAVWLAAEEVNREGALREATSHIEDVAGPYYPGSRKSSAQGLLFPRSDAVDEDGFLLPDLPVCIPQAVTLLAVHALSARLSAVEDTAGGVKSFTKKVGPIQKTTEFWGSEIDEKKYGTIFKALVPILRPGNPWAPGGGWAFC